MERHVIAVESQPNPTCVLAGLSVGDELGFKESLGNVESDRRRAISYRNGAPELVGVLPSARQQEVSLATIRTITACCNHIYAGQCTRAACSAGQTH